MNRQSKKPKNIWEFLRECPLVSMILLSVAGYTIYALFGAISGEFKLKISKDHTIFMSAMIKEKPFTHRQQKQIPVLMQRIPMQLYRLFLQITRLPMVQNQLIRFLQPSHCEKHVLPIMTTMTVQLRQPHIITQLWILIILMMLHLLATPVLRLCMTMEVSASIQAQTSITGMASPSGI